MIRLHPPIEFPWLADRFWEVPHQLGSRIAICRIELPPKVLIPRSAVGEAERVRASRMTDPAEAQRFLAGRAVLRGLLASVLGCPRDTLDLTTDEFGKPRLTRAPLTFSMSRSGSWLLLGVSEASEIGVDIERVREVPDREALARTHLSVSEYGTWSRCNSASSDAMFLGFWTRKEACVKAAGVGLAMPLRRLDVDSVSRYRPERVVFRLGARQWSACVLSLPMPAGLVAAAASIG